MSLISVLDGVGSQRHAPAALPPGKSRYPFYRKLGVPHNPSGQLQKIRLPPVLDSLIFQPVANRYTDWANPDPNKRHSNI